MTARIIKKGAEDISINDLMENVKNSQKIIECGALFSFEGIVRGEEVDKKTVKMDLSTPDIEDAENELQTIITDIKEKYGVLEIEVVHYIGKFIPGDTLFLAVVAGAHRKETIAALNELIDRVKYEIDFKKEEHTEDGTNIIMSGG
jgi:molybdopterin synthase catalytic subunit